MMFRNSIGGNCLNCRAVLGTLVKWDIKKNKKSEQEKQGPTLNWVTHTTLLCGFVQGLGKPRKTAALTVRHIGIYPRKAPLRASSGYPTHITSIYINDLVFIRAPHRLIGLDR
jgi:hypothetical protein